MKLRVQERIPIILKCIDANPEVLLKMYGMGSGIWEHIKEDVEREWYAYPQARLTEILLDWGFLHNNVHLLGIEEDDWLINNNYVKPEEILFYYVGEKEISKEFNNRNVLLKDLPLSYLKSVYKKYEKGDISIYDLNYLRYLKQKIGKQIKLRSSTQCCIPASKPEIDGSNPSFATIILKYK